MMYRLRHTIGKNVVLFEDEIYRFNHTLDYDYDVENFKKEISLAQKSANPDDKMAHFQSAVKLYKGDYLPHTGATGLLANEMPFRKVFFARC